MLSLVSSHRFALAAQLCCVPDGESRTSPQHHPLQRHYRTKDPTYFHKGLNSELWLEQNTKHFRRPPSPCCPRKKVWWHPKENFQADHSGWPLKSPLMALYTQAYVHTCTISVHWNKNKTNANAIGCWCWDKSTGAPNFNIQLSQQESGNYISNHLPDPRRPDYTFPYIKSYFDITFSLMREFDFH